MKIKQQQVLNYCLSLALLFGFGCSKVQTNGSLKTNASLKSSTAASGKVRKVLFIGIDGCINATITPGNTPNLQALINTGYYSSNALNENPTFSGPNWTTILTGTTVVKHGITSNTWGTDNNLLTNKSFFDAIKAAAPAKRTVSIVSYADLNIGNPISVDAQIVRDDDATYKYQSVDLGGNNYDSSTKNEVEIDADTKNKVVAELTNNNPDVIYCHFDNVDHTGHTTGFYDLTQPPTTASNVAYLAAVQGVDTHVGAMIAALKNRPNYANEDWLVVVTTDHGGIGYVHGGPSYVERNSFIILNDPGAVPVTLANVKPTTTYQTTPNSVSALAFGNNIYGKLPSVSGFNIGASSSFTIEFRVRATSATSDPVIIGNKDWSSGYHKGIIIANNSGKIRANFGDGTNRLDLDGVDLTDNNWHYVSIVVDRSSQTATMYDAGVQVSQASISAVGGFVSGSNFYIGQDATTTYSPYFTGNIAGVRLFNAALSATTIANNVFTDVTSSHPNYANLKYYVKGRDGSGTQYAATGGKTATTIILNSGATASWSTVTAPIYLSSSTDYHNAPHTFSIAPTILNFLGIAKPSNYDGSTLISF